MQTLSLALKSPEETTAYAATLASRLGPGDVILLTGDVGAGKTHFARSVIQSLLQVPEDVPSPTFTLVQTYHAAACDIWHADLYRINSTFEIEELGLTEAFETGLCLVEWPDRLGDLALDGTLSLTFTSGDAEETRNLVAEWTSSAWSHKLSVWQQHAEN